MPRAFLFIAFCLYLALTPSPGSARGGGVIDGGGGGDFLYHTREEVIQAIEDVWARMIELNFKRNPVGAAFAYSQEADPARGGDPQVKDILRTILGAANDDIQTHLEVDREKIANSTRYIREQKLFLKEDGYCTGGLDENYLASVSSLNRSGKICISVFGLMRLPSGSLRADLFGLFIHEAAHLNGFGEEDARIVQRYFLKNFRYIMRQAGERTRWQRKIAFHSKAASYWTTLIRYEPIELSYVKSVYRLADRFKLLLPDGPGVPDDLGEVRPDLLSQLQSQLELLIKDIRLFARELEDDFWAGQLRIQPRHLRRMEDLATRMVEIEILHHTWLFGDHEYTSSNFFRQRSREEMQNDLHEVYQASRPELLKNPDLRPRIVCEERSQETLEDKVRFEADPFPRCWREDPIPDDPVQPAPETGGTSQFMMDPKLLNPRP